MDANNCPSAPNVDKNYCLSKASAETVVGYTGDSGSYVLKMQSGGYYYQVTPTTTPSQVQGTYALRLNNGGVDNSDNIISTSDGGVAISGIVDAYYSGTGDPPPCSPGGCAGTGQALVAKFNSSGSLTWAKGWNGSSQEDEANSIVQLGDGSYIMSGTSKTSGITNDDALLVKINSDGTQAWSRLIGNNTNADFGYNVVPASDSGYIITGYASGTDFVAKFDTSGTLSWYRSITGVTASAVIAATSDGGYILAGQNFLIKFTTTGSVSWTKTWTNSTSMSYANSILQTSDGGYLYAGSTSTYGSGGNDAYMIKFDSTGAFTWARTWGGTGDDYGFSAIQTNDGGYMLTGNNSSNNAFIAKFNSSGALSWSREFGKGNEGARTVVQMSDGGYAIIGDSYSYDVQGDVFVARYDAFGGIANCDTNLCRTITGTTTSPTITISTGSTSTGSTAPAITTPGTSLGSISPTITVLAQ